MSISNPKVENPCTKFIEFKGDKGQFFFYDKEKEEQVEILMPIYFVVLDELSTISGYNKKNDCGIFSNEVHSTAKEILRVKTFKGGESVIGLYNDVKDSIKALGGKYTKSVYALLINKDKSTELVNFKFKGAAFSAWLDKKINPNTAIIGITDFTQEKNGNTVYTVPVFQGFKLDPATLQAAVEADETLQDYLKEYKSQLPEKEIAKAEANEEVDFIANGNFVKESAKKQIVDKSKAAVDQLDDLPF